MDRTIMFHSGTYLSSDPEETAALNAVAEGGYAPIFQDDGPETLRCSLCSFVTVNELALAAHRRAQHQGRG